jgi:CheY-like chemotaxis protein
MLQTDLFPLPASASPFRALIVDDERLLRGLVRRALLRAGFEVTEAAEGHAALTLVRAQPFDLVLSDVEMPVMNGIELLARISAEHSKLPVILLSGSFQLGPEQVPADFGAFELLRKPFSLQVIQEAALRAVAAGGTATPRLPAESPSLTRAGPSAGAVLPRVQPAFHSAANRLLQKGFDDGSNS